MGTSRDRESPHALCSGMKRLEMHVALAFLGTMAVCHFCTPTARASGLPLLQQPGIAKNEQRSGQTPLELLHDYRIPTSHPKPAPEKGIPQDGVPSSRTPHTSTFKSNSLRDEHANKQEHVASGKRQLQQSSCPVGPPDNRCESSPTF